MFHQAVRRRHEHAFVAVLPPDEIRRRSALPVNLDDHALAILIAHVATPDNDLIAHFSAHPDHLPHRLDTLAVSSIRAARPPLPGAWVPRVRDVLQPARFEAKDRTVETFGCEAACGAGHPNDACEASGGAGEAPPAVSVTATVAGTRAVL